MTTRWKLFRITVLLIAVFFIVSIFWPREIKVNTVLTDSVYWFDLGSRTAVISVGDDNRLEIVELDRDNPWSRRGNVSYLHTGSIIFAQLIESEELQPGMGIFQRTPGDEGREPILLTIGIGPILSPPQNHFLYYSKLPDGRERSGEISIYEIALGNHRLLRDDSGYFVPIWLNDREFVYKTHELVEGFSTNFLILNIETNAVRRWPYGPEYTPAAVSHTGVPRQVVIKRGKLGHSLELVNLDDFSREKLISYSVSSIGHTVVWNAEGTGFFFTRQPLSNLMKINESKGLYHFNIESRDEVLLQNPSTLFFGAAFPSDYFTVTESDV